MGSWSLFLLTVMREGPARVHGADPLASQAILSSFSIEGWLLWQRGTALGPLLEMGLCCPAASEGEKVPRDPWQNSQEA